MNQEEFEQQFVTLTALKEWLAGRKVILEPDDSVAKKQAAGKEAEIWCFDGDRAAIRRGDGRFYECAMGQHPGGYPVPMIVEEPNLPAPEDGGARVVGHVVIEQNAEGKVRVKPNNGLNGPILELLPSSISKGELAESGSEYQGNLEANPQRIKGVIAVYVRTVEFASGVTLMTPAEFVAQSTDGRSLGALVKAGLLK